MRPFLKSVVGAFLGLFLAFGYVAHNEADGALKAVASALPGGTLPSSAFPLLAPDGTTGAPSYSFSSTTGAGLWLGGVQFGSGGTTDVFLVRDAANALSLRNGANPQKLCAYNAFTDLSNYERACTTWGSNVATIGTEAQGTGTLRKLTLNGVNLEFQNSGLAKWQITGSNFLAVTDNAFDIGASGATRPRNLYLASSIKQVGGITTVGTVGVSTSVASANVTAQSAANASIATVTAPAADTDYEVGGQMNVTVVTTLSTSLFCTYTDVANVSRTMILPIQQLTGTFVAAGLITATGAWEAPRMHIRSKASTAITCGTSAGTFTGVTYSASFVITQLN